MMIVASCFWGRCFVFQMKVFECSNSFNPFGLYVNACFLLRWVYLTHSPGSLAFHASSVQKEAHLACPYITWSKGIDMSCIQISKSEQSRTCYHLEDRCNKIIVFAWTWTKNPAKQYSIHVPFTKIYGGINHHLLPRVTSFVQLWPRPDLNHHPRSSCWSRWPLSGHRRLVMLHASISRKWLWVKKNIKQIPNWVQGNIFRWAWILCLTCFWPDMARLSSLQRAIYTIGWILALQVKTLLPW